MPDDTPTPKRRPISKRLRFEILRRDNFRCRYCGATPEEAELTVDHVLAVALGGENKPENLVTACRPCNSGKSSTAPDAAIVNDLDELGRAMADALALANQARMEKRDEMRQAINHWRHHTWGRWTIVGTDETLPLPTGWQGSIERFLSLGLDMVDLDRFVEMAMGSKARGDGVFPYFCGIAWNELREVQRDARSMVAHTLEAEALGEEEIL